MEKLDVKTTIFLKAQLRLDNMTTTTSEKCNSCKTAITNVQGTVRFKCPGCSKEDIIRCDRCRRFAARYKCFSCGLEGPN